MISDQEVRKQIDDATKAGPTIPVHVEMPFAEAVKRVLNYAAEEADRLAHRHIGTEHVLLGLLRERGGVAERCLAQKGLSADLVRKQIRDQAVSSADESVSAPSRVEAFMALERLTVLVEQLSRVGDAQAREFAERIELELDLVRRALNG